jgi:hypothetical protein
MGVGKGKGFGLGRRAKTVHVVMAVALDVGHAQAGGEHRVLLHGQAGLAGQVFTRQQQALRLAGDACRAVQRTVNALAGLAGNAAVAQRQAALQHVRMVIGFVQDHRHRNAQGVDGLLQRHLARDGLLQQQRALQQWRAAGAAASARQNSPSACASEKVSLPSSVTRQSLAWACSTAAMRDRRSTSASGCPTA